jgi:hypothetical protein
MSEDSGDDAPDPVARALSGQPRDYAWELAELRKVLDESPVAGFPRRDAELAELRRLIGRYPAEARAMLRDLEEVEDQG